MGIREEIQADLAEAFDTDLADAVLPFTGGITIPGAWDPVTETGGDPVVIAYSGRGVFDGFKLDRVDGANIRATDQLLIALINETVGGVPDIGHQINGFDVINVQPDPALATYQIQLRKT
ncbi:hypothetical protein LS633_25190 [Pseudomonas sp. NIBR-H-19]|uniref:hypothetical protein n=1 Tax=Pseudomonas sp. NIBR-H-19 TaxID=2901380 RepID=UPI001E3E52AD|nr:hypothetical protein [Pseudomonas sp. NIBR-H-19]UHC81663.1 hypothetical protein LS633_25190 [Pseudomonas sp. NIBR-H-19]